MGFIKMFLIFLILVLMIVAARSYRYEGCKSIQQWVTAKSWKSHFNAQHILHCKVHTVQSRPLVWSTDVRSTRLYGQFLAGPERIGHFVSEKARLKVKKTRLYGQFRSIWSKFEKEDDFIWG